MKELSIFILIIILSFVFFIIIEETVNKAAISESLFSPFEFQKIEKGNQESE